MTQPLAHSGAHDAPTCGSDRYTHYCIQSVHMQDITEQHPRTNGRMHATVGPRETSTRSRQLVRPTAESPCRLWPRLGRSSPRSALARRLIAPTACRSDPVIISASEHRYTAATRSLHMHYSDSGCSSCGILMHTLLLDVSTSRHTRLGASEGQANEGSGRSQ